MSEPMPTVSGEAVKRWGNHLGLRLPAALAHEAMENVVVSRLCSW